MKFIEACQKKLISEIKRIVDGGQFVSDKEWESGLFYAVANYKSEDIHFLKNLILNYAQAKDALNRNTNLAKTIFFASVRFNIPESKIFAETLLRFPAIQNVAHVQNNKALNNAFVFKWDNIIHLLLKNEKVLNKNISEYVVDWAYKNKKYMILLQILKKNHVYKKIKTENLVLYIEKLRDPAVKAIFSISNHEQNMKLVKPLLETISQNPNYKLIIKYLIKNQFFKSEVVENIDKYNITSEVKKDIIQALNLSLAPEINEITNTLPMPIGEELLFHFTRLSQAQISQTFLNNETIKNKRQNSLTIAK